METMPPQQETIVPYLVSRIVGLPRPRFYELITKVTEPILDSYLQLCNVENVLRGRDAPELWISHVAERITAMCKKDYDSARDDDELATNDAMETSHGDEDRETVENLTQPFENEQLNNDNSEIDHHAVRVANTIDKRFFAYESLKIASEAILDLFEKKIGKETVQLCCPGLVTVIRNEARAIEDGKVSAYTIDRVIRWCQRIEICLSDIQHDLIGYDTPAQTCTYLKASIETLRSAIYYSAIFRDLPSFVYLILHAGQQYDEKNSPEFGIKLMVYTSLMTSDIVELRRHLEQLKSDK